MKNRFHILGIACLGLLGATDAHAEPAMECACQHAYICGADECEPNEGVCANVTVAISQSPARIRYCVTGDCLEGEAALGRPREEEVWLHGSYRHSRYPEQNPTSVTVLLDRSTGVGFLQTYDEQGVDQVSLICAREDDGEE